MAVNTLDNGQLNTVIQNETKIVIIDFYSESCGPCKSLMPVLEEISNENADVEIYKVLASENSEITERFSVMAVPTLLFFKGGEVVKKTIGFKSKESINDILATLEGR